MAPGDTPDDDVTELAKVLNASLEQLVALTKHVEKLMALTEETLERVVALEGRLTSEGETQ